MIERLERLVITITSRPTKGRERLHNGRFEWAHCDDVRVRPKTNNADANGMLFLDYSPQQRREMDMPPEPEEKRMRRLHIAALRALAARWGIKISIRGRV